MDDLGAKNMPSEDEIRRICEEEIQPTWSEKVRRKKMASAYRNNRPALQTVKLKDFPDHVRLMIDSINKSDDMNGRSRAMK